MSDSHYDTDITLSDLDDYYQQDPVVETRNVESKEDNVWMAQFLASNPKLMFGWVGPDEPYYDETAEIVFNKAGYQALHEFTKDIIRVAYSTIMGGESVPFTPLDIQASGINVTELIGFLEDEIKHKVLYMTGDVILQRFGNQAEEFKNDIVFDIDKLGSFLINLKLHFVVDASMETL